MTLASDAQNNIENVTKRRRKRRTFSRHGLKRMARTAMIVLAYTVGIAIPLLLWLHLVRD